MKLPKYLHHFELEYLNFLFRIIYLLLNFQRLLRHYLL